MPDDSIVTCTNCGRNASVSFSYCLRHGWPKCCGYTMRLSVSPDLNAIDAAVGDAFAPLRRLRGEDA